MRNLFILLICTFAVTGFAANPAYTDFRGTNEVLVTTNPTTGRIIIGPATPISTQINAAQVWTNDTGAQAIRLVPTNNFPIVITDLVNGRTINLSYSGAPEIVLVDGTAGSDWYSYFNGGVAKSVFSFNDESGYGGALLIDAAGEDGNVGFHFSTGVSNVLGTNRLVEFQDNHIDAFYLRGTGEMWTPTFQTTSTKTTNATPLDVLGLISAYNGVATLLHNTSTNTLITVGSSPFNFTNTASQTIIVYLDANGATTTANLNGQTIFKSLAAGDHTIILKPGAYTTITYAIATPIMTWTEL